MKSKDQVKKILILTTPPQADGAFAKIPPT